MFCSHTITRYIRLLQLLFAVYTAAILCNPMKRASSAVMGVKQKTVGRQQANLPCKMAIARKKQSGASFELSLTMIAMLEIIPSGVAPANPEGYVHMSFFCVEGVHHSTIDVVGHHTFLQLPYSMLSDTILLNGRFPAIVMGGAVGLGVALLRQEPFPVHQAMSIVDELEVLFWSWWWPFLHQNLLSCFLQNRRSALGF